MGVGSEFNRYDRGNSFVKGRSINIEVGYLTTFGEVDPKVLRVSAGERIYGASSLEGHGSSGSVFASGVALSNGDSSSLVLASNANLLDSGVVF
jgi:hypothetical protein